ncbi:polymorphic toxin-type HINT domain-containing protein [Stratiformator vulcanicus]|uniref:MafB19-like deaminase domain-containing protein n=1 Tax=Stratiformator vulcanicus TaxID=2527980 RepID=A0A517QWV3_9PLAN|nr:polymorphic toxin-type HINT domain-containing protein [Stratiformator vulcanicus]QDT36048.1 hypothetical protein Pan189_04030 [Stratiformator vulcanicus]
MTVETHMFEIPPENSHRSRRSLWRSVIGLTLLLGSAATLAGNFFFGEATATAVPTAVIATPAEFDTSHRKPIEKIKIGDKVLARDEHGEAIGWQEVDEIYERTSDHLRFLKVRSDTGEYQTFETTDEHPFWSASREAWIDAGELKAGEKLTGPDGQTHTVVFTEREEHPEGVAEAHTYYVTAVDAPRGPPVLVHNADYEVNGIPRGFQDIDSFRSRNGLSPFDPSDPASGTVARISVNGKTFYGVNGASSQIPPSIRRGFADAAGTNRRARALHHAEAQALMEASGEIISSARKNITIFVDRRTCRFCQNDGTIEGIKDLLELDSVTILDKLGNINVF